MCGIGAVFTPPERRGHGHASALVEELVVRAGREGALLAGLFSEIGSEFYARLGFAVVPLDEVTITVAAGRRGGAPAMLVRAGEERDLENVAAMHATRAADAPFALRRDRGLVHYALSKKRLLAGLGPPGLRQLEFFVAEEGASAVAYVVLNVNANGWTLEEAGDRDPAGARLGAMLQVLLAREPSHRTPLIRAWWPRAFPVPPQIQLTDVSVPKDLFMVRPLADVAHADERRRRVLLARGSFLIAAGPKDRPYRSTSVRSRFLFSPSSSEKAVAASLHALEEQRVLELALLEIVHRQREVSLARWQRISPGTRRSDRRGPSARVATGRPTATDLLERGRRWQT